MLNSLFLGDPKKILDGFMSESIGHVIIVGSVESEK